MKNKYLIYGVINFLALVAYIYSTYFYFLIIWIVGIIFPIVLTLLLKLEARFIQIELQGPLQGKEGQLLSFIADVKSQYNLIVSGRIDYLYVYENLTLKNRIEKNMFIPLGMKEGKKEYHFKATYCGEVIVSYRDLYLYDVFGFCRVSLHQNQKHHMIVYPSKIEMNLLYNELSKPYENGLLQYQYRKGLDMSEIYDLKTYYPGDDIRHVHWKLSAKMQQMLLKEGTHHSSFEIVLLVDIGLNDHQDILDKHVVSKSLAFAMSVSEKLLIKDIGHYVALYDIEKFYWLEMNHLQDFYQSMDQWISKGIVPNNGDALNLFVSEQLDLDFTKMIYVTAGNFNEELTKLNDNLSVTAITIKDHLNKVQTTQHLQNHLYELPLDLIDENTYRFEI